MRHLVAFAALLVATGIGVGALGSHALRGVLDERQLGSLETAVQYQIFNAIGLLLLGGWIRGGESGLRWPAGLIAAGVVCFSGGIYLMLAGAPRLLGYVTPLGGVLLMAGWLALAWCLLMKKNS